MTWEVFRRKRTRRREHPLEPKFCVGLVGHRAWQIVAEDTHTYIERCSVCGRERARISHL